MTELLQGNRACVQAAIASGCRFFAGYPITPSSEIAESMARLLPEAGGVFMQMEDEMASLGAVLGASLAGSPAMTATSGPGFSLMQEHIGYAALAEIPCVVVDVMRGGPSTGLPTRPSQGDVMQARWGTHGDHPVVALAPASVSEIYELTSLAFALSERLRLPALVLYDEVVGHLREPVDPGSLRLSRAERRRPTVEPAAYRPYAPDADLVPPLADFGTGYRFHVTGLTHDEAGRPTEEPAVVGALHRRLQEKVARARDDVVSFAGIGLEDAEVVVVAYGIAARAAERAVTDARSRGERLGLFRPRTLWPFPDVELRAVAERAHTIVVAEMNLGQMLLEVERVVAGRARVEACLRADGTPLTPEDVAHAVASAAGALA
ncbi:MAG: 2-oxoacid:acceptor oxidoreductase subunit alpha [Chloroflexota bacterium]|nr:2-oxoacid:acceptor oxidoreductase subunit alpha [Chloroflexota bacterium]MDE3194251.1 2-oxoacid:acceptor oxidoreductase subunit alpha [Chloroflexota bacterium]